MRDRISPLVSAEVGDRGPATVGIDADDAVRHARYSVRAAGAREDGIERVTDKSDVGDAAHQASERRARLARRQAVDEGRASAVAVDPRDPRAGRAPRVRTHRRHDDAVRVRRRRARTADSAFGHVEVAVGTELEPTGVVETFRKYGHGSLCHRGVVLRHRLAGRERERQRERRAGPGDYRQEPRILVVLHVNSLLHASLIMLRPTLVDLALHGTSCRARLEIILRPALCAWHPLNEWSRRHRR